MTEPKKAVFLSYASEDTEPARRIADQLRSAGIEVWFDQSELRGGDAWDRQISRQIRECALFIAVVSAHTDARSEGYFRREWRVAVDRTRDMADDEAFLLPVVIDGTPNATARVPDRFCEVQWTHLPSGEVSPAFVERTRRLLSHEGPHAPTPRGTPSAASSVGGYFRASTLRASREPAHNQSANWRPKPALLLVAVVVVMALGYFAVDRLVLSNRLTDVRRAPAGPSPAVLPGQSAIPEKSIAVLPFVDMSEKKDQGYFSDGLSEQVLNLLAGIPTLSVIGRTSSFRFKGQDNDLRDIGTKLGAAYVLEGSVRRAGDRVRVIAQLISTRNGVHRWSNTYDRPFGDVLQLQDEIAAGVARAMEVTVGSDTLQSHAASRNPEAYDLYLHGLHAVDRYDREGFETAINYFQQALDLDPGFAAAATELGRMVVFQAEFGFAPVVETYERARRNLETAIRLDPSSGMAHAWLGWVHTAYDWDWPAADAEMREALRLSPRDPVVLLCASRLSHALGRWDDAIRQLTSALTLDPLYPAASNNLSEVYARVGRLAEAEAAERRVIAISPTYSSAPHNLAVVLLALGRREEALRVIMAAPQDSYEQTHALILIYHALGRRSDSDAQLAKFTGQQADYDAFEIAEAHGYRGEIDEAFRWLDRAYQQKDSGLYLLKGDLLLRKLEPDPRYKSFLHKMNLPE